MWKGLMGAVIHVDYYNYWQSETQQTARKSVVSEACVLYQPTTRAATYHQPIRVVDS